MENVGVDKNRGERAVMGLVVGRVAWRGHIFCEGGVFQKKQPIPPYGLKYKIVLSLDSPSLARSHIESKIVPIMYKIGTTFL